MSAYTEGQQAARQSAPFSANPHAKPAKPESGDNYPGDWALWSKGWLSIADPSCKRFAQFWGVLDDHIKAGL